MAKNLLDDIFYIQSKFLKLVEPTMQKYFDYDSSMLIDQISTIVERKCTNYIKVNEKGTAEINSLQTFYENESLYFIDSDYSHKDGIDNTPTYKDVADEFPQYFDFDIEDDEASIEHYKIYIILSYMAYVYFKQRTGCFSKPSHPYIEGIDLEYQYTLHKKIYPEMLSLYRMILESKKYKKRGDKLTISFKQDKIDLNTSAWFLDDMEAYFKNRFPDITLEDINELLPPPNKAGRKSKDPYVMILIWGTYQLMKNHHFAFKDSKVKISKEICDFIIKYLNYQNIEHDYVDTDIKDNLKDMIKRNYTPKWDLPWRNVFSSVQEKQPESELEKLNQPSRKYDLSNL